MSMAVVALIVALVAAGGAIYSILVGVDIATRKQPKTTSLPAGRYTVRKVNGTPDTYDLELIEKEEEKK